MRQYNLSFMSVDDGLTFVLTRPGTLGMGKAMVASLSWSAEMHPAVSLLKLLVDNDAAEVRNGGIWVGHKTVACMSAAEAQILRLPARCPYSLRLESQGAVSDLAFSIRYSWLGKDGSSQVGLRRNGVIVASVADSFLVSEPLFSLLVEVDRLNTLEASGAQMLDARMVQFDRVKIALARATGDASSDNYLDRLTIHHATALAIEQQDGNAGLFAPVLFGECHDLLASSDHEESGFDRRVLLPSEHATKFRTTLFPNHGARSHYRLKDGVYAVVDAPVEAALRVLQKINASDPATQAAFKADPRSFLTAAIEAAGGTGDIICDGAVMRGPMEYGERVLGIRAWDGAGVSFQVPVFHNGFRNDGAAVETYTLDVPGAAQPLFVRPADVSRLRDAIEAAVAANCLDVVFDGKKFPLSSEFEQTVNALVGQVSPPQDKQKSAPKAPAAKPALMVLRVAENEEDLIFNARLRDPRGDLLRGATADDLRTTPMPHQIDGISWLRRAFLSGMPGALLADDMGLGKTFQVLAFLSWLRNHQSDNLRPILVVAPKKLLENWLDEVADHIGPKGLGRPVLAFDEHLAGLKVAGPNDGELGRYTLDANAFRAAEWVLTTYETLRDYHSSFAKVRFSVAVYDEAQKIKSMASLINNAAKCQQPDFTILMTGTPIENSVMDLWTLLDVAWPGFLRLSGKEFAKEYGNEPSAEQIEGLKARLIGPVQVGGRECPPVMLRRFKSGVLTGLPAKTEQKWPVDMAPEQVRVYDAVISDQRSRKVPALQALQALRSAAFHPDLRMPASIADHERLIAISARFKALFNVLDAASRSGERILVFVDLREGQRVLAELIRHRYRMKRHPQIINGDTSTKALKQIKDDFQGGKGFDVLLLGPRSAGFGLTLTAANQVVHMNRWWNPAVEDQCSDRVYRLGQDKPVTIHLPIAVHPLLGEGSFDVVLDAMLTKKRSLSQDIIVPTAMTEADFRSMFADLVGAATSIGDNPRDVDIMGWKDFENWTAQQFIKVGYQANTTPRSHDGGADIILRPPTRPGARPIICQCKHRSLGEGAVDEQAVEDVLRARTAYGMVYPWLVKPVLIAVTNSRFTLRATSSARESGVVLVDGARIDGLSGIAKDLLESAGAAFVH
jgi:hypothetical protein